MLVVAVAMSTAPHQEIPPFMYAVPGGFRPGAGEQGGFGRGPDLDADDGDDDPEHKKK